MSPVPSPRCGPHAGAKYERAVQLLPVIYTLKDTAVGLTWIILSFSKCSSVETVLFARGLDLWTRGAFFILSSLAALHKFPSRFSVSQKKTDPKNKAMKLIAPFSFLCKCMTVQNGAYCTSGTYLWFHSDTF